MQFPAKHSLGNAIQVYFIAPSIKLAPKNREAFAVLPQKIMRDDLWLGDPAAQALGFHAIASLAKGR
jgi:hypothetical protein